MEALSASRIRETIRQLNRMDLDRADYDYIKMQISRIFSHITISSSFPVKGSRLYRGVIYTDKPLDVSQLGHPPSKKAVNFQRCNPPNNPMFYCSPDPEAVFYELNVKPGDRVYISMWTVLTKFYITQLLSETAETSDDYRRDLVLSFFETKFSQPIHEVYSSQYKITSAIAEHLSQGTIELPDNPEVGGVSYPSVCHPARSNNIAIRPEIAEKHLALNYVEEVIIEAVVERTIEYKRTDISSHFTDGKIAWAGKPLHWNCPPVSRVINMTREPDGWILRDQHGNTVNPG